MKKDIILAGVGGQGILTIATVIGYAAIESGKNLKQAEVHGMSQRGGDVQSHLRISDSVIYSDLIAEGKCDLILSVEPMEALRYLPYLAKDGWLITNLMPFKNMAGYPDDKDVEAEIYKIPQHIALNADEIAKDNGIPRSMNIIMLGAALQALGLDEKKIEAGIEFIFGKKGEDIVKANLKALQLGKEFAKTYKR
jgi:indolepyruvate ferredoxin oxidoreductase beta subunit